MNFTNSTKIDEWSDKEIVERILNGESDLYELIVRRYNQPLYRVLRGYVKIDTDVEDIMQDTYILAFQKLHQFRGESSISTWLIRIGINEALKIIRKTKKQREDNPHESLDNDFIQISDKMNPEIKRLQLETDSAIEQAIDDLPSMYRSVFIMKEVEEMSIKEVAKCLELSEENVKVRLHRAKNMLKKVLVNDYPTQSLYAYGSKHCDNMTNNVMHAVRNMKVDRSSEF